MLRKRNIFFVGFLFFYVHFFKFEITHPILEKSGLIVCLLCFFMKLVSSNYLFEVFVETQVNISVFSLSASVINLDTSNLNLLGFCWKETLLIETNPSFQWVAENRLMILVRKGILIHIREIKAHDVWCKWSRTLW